MAIKTTLLFTLDEYQNRIAQIRAHMRARKIDVLLIDQTEFLFYVSGFGISENMYRACAIPLEGEPVFMLRSMDLLPFQESTWITDYIHFSDWEDPIERLAGLFRARGWQNTTVGIDGDSYCMTLRRFEQLKAAMPSARFADFSGVLAELRRCKSAQEIDYVRRAAKIADIALTEGFSASGMGKSERDAAAAVSHAFMRHGADSGRAGPITQGIGDAFLHGNLHNDPLKEGDILHMELVPFVNGYSARLMRPAVIGKANAAQHALALQLVEIQDRQFAAMRPGVSAKTIDALVRKPVLEAGLRDEFPNITGYTLGYYAQSTPHTSDFTGVFLPNSEWLLEPGMIFHMYVSANGIAFSETVLVTDSGIELLTHSPRGLTVI